MELKQQSDTVLYRALLLGKHLENYTHEKKKDSIHVSDMFSPGCTFHVEIVANDLSPPESRDS